MEKIAVIGSGGSGKSTFSKKLGEVLNLPVYHLDAYYWKPGWVETSHEEWDRFNEELVKKVSWIIDGNYGRTMKTRVEKADTVIFLYMPTYLCIYRIIKRRIMYGGKTRPDMGDGCSERLDWDFIKWVWDYNKAKAPGVLRKLQTYEKDKNIIILKNTREVNEFLININESKTWGVDAVK